MSNILPESPSDLAPDDMYVWALFIDHVRLVVVVESGYSLDAPVSLHLALSATKRSVNEVLANNGWTPRAWLPHSWGRLARVDLEEGA